MEEWLAGFVSADGTVGTDITKNQLHRIGYRMKPYIRIFQTVTPKNLAGFFEGDGCIIASITKKTNYYILNPKTSIAQ
ncbi:unnamed protein product, partial [marine sediment metagenome]